MTPVPSNDTQPPLVLTLAIDPKSFAHFDGMRKRHFPSRRNVIPAHLTLFHHLPGENERAIAARLQMVSAAQPPFAIAVAGIRFLGNGSAYRVRAPDLDRLRADLATHWADWLTPQDAQKFSAHVTIQNKVPAREARTLFEELESGFTPFEAMATGLLLWRYLQGPWERIETFSFRRAA